MTDYSIHDGMRSPYGDAKDERNYGGLVHDWFLMRDSLRIIGDPLKDLERLRWWPRSFPNGRVDSPRPEYLAVARERRERRAWMNF